MTAQALDLRPTGTDPGQIAAYARLLGDVFGGDKFTEAAIAWRYRDNPAGQVVGMDAWDGERLAAHYVTCPLEARIDGAVVKGLLSLNTATHPDSQGRGLFTTLAEAAYAQGVAATAMPFVIGVANANSTPGFVKRLGFQHVGRLHAGVLASLPRRFAPADVQYQGVWRDPLLAWRLANPAGRYAAARRDGLIAVWARTHLPFVRCAALLPDDGQTLPPGAAPLAASLFLGLEPRMSLGRQGFLAVPEAMRPSPLNLIWRPLSPAVPAELRADAVALNFLDFDPY